MTRAILLCLGLFGCGVLAAQEPEVFTPPQAYPQDRYEAMWAKNPFTLKTAPAVVENISFAKDLAIGSHFGDTQNPTFMIVNTKTHERIRLRKDEPAKNGMRLESFHVGATRKETTVKVTLGSETTDLSYNNEYLSQMAASKSAKAPVPGRPGAPGVVPVPGTPMNMQSRQPGMPSTIKMPAAPTMPRPSTAGTFPGGMRNGASPVAGVAAAGGGGVPGVALNTSGNGSLNLTVSAGGQVQPGAGGPLVSQADAPPVPVRRRMISPPPTDALAQ